LSLPWELHRVLIAEVLRRPKLRDEIKTFKREFRKKAATGRQTFRLAELANLKELQSSTNPRDLQHRIAHLVILDDELELKEINEGVPWGHPSELQRWFSKWASRVHEKAVAKQEAMRKEKKWFLMRSHWSPNCIPWLLFTIPYAIMYPLV